MILLLEGNSLVEAPLELESNKDNGPLPLPAFPQPEQSYKKPRWGWQF
jgi:hypothetical protein